jgi:6-phosphogluconolactonase
MRATLFCLSMFALNIAFAQSNEYLLVGSYTSGKSDGIYVYDFDQADGTTRLVSTTKTPNPSYLAVSPDQSKIYAVAENADSTALGVGGAVAAFSFDPKSGSLKRLNEQFSYGKHPCYVAVDDGGKWIFVANYSSGTAAIYPVNQDGSLGAVKQVIQDSGSGAAASRQENPHAHSTVLSPDNKYLFIQDLGLDKIFVYRFDNRSGELQPATPAFAASVAGSGPRHFEFHPNSRWAYLIEELTGTVVAFNYSDGKLDSIQRISALPAGFKGEIGSADIHVSKDGRFVYCSNRGESNTIAIFSIDQATGKLKLAGHQSTLGKTPRNFNFDPSGKFLLVANQDTNDIVIFKINQDTGLLTDTGKRIKVSKPVCVKWIKR